MEQRTRYYQIITKTFLEFRGAPFFLSSKEIELINSWEIKHIPLRIVLEGIKNCFESKKTLPKQTSKSISLLKCDYYVNKAFNLFQTRQVGKKQNVIKRDKKGILIEKNIASFLKSLPKELEFLRDDFEQALTLLKANGINEEKLEYLDQKIDEKILAQKAIEFIEMSVTRNKILIADKIERTDSPINIQKIRFIRMKYSIPRLSFFYY